MHPHDYRMSVNVLNDLGTKMYSVVFHQLKSLCLLKDASCSVASGSCLKAKGRRAWHSQRHPSAEGHEEQCQQTLWHLLCCFCCCCLHCHYLWCKQVLSHTVHISWFKPQKIRTNLYLSLRTKQLPSAPHSRKSSSLALSYVCLCTCF